MQSCQWNMIDLIMALAIIAGAGLAGFLIFRKVENKRVRLILLALIALLLVLLWMELAVGIFGSAIGGN